jgi:thiosulfate dehydrogenase
MKVDRKQTEDVIIYTARSAMIIAIWFVVAGMIVISTFFLNGTQAVQTAVASKPSVPMLMLEEIKVSKASAVGMLWSAPDEKKIPAGKAGEMIRYGKELIVHTAKYFGPNGSIAKISNGMNCQNCHLDGGSRLFANNYASFISSYPKKSARSGRIEQPVKRISDCFERSLAGKVPPVDGKEVEAMLAYLQWMGSGVKKKQKVFGSATEKPGFLNRAADPKKGLLVYNSKCKSCHGADGKGQLLADQSGYVYPPLWGPHSYNDGAGMYRISNFAGFVKNNMPFGASYERPQLSDEEAWDVAAFVNSQPRRHWDSKNDYRNLSTKPIDAPFGPYPDGYSERQHKYGPFKPIVAASKVKKVK